MIIFKQQQGKGTLVIFSNLGVNNTHTWPIVQKSKLFLASITESQNLWDLKNFNLHAEIRQNPQCHILVSGPSAWIGWKELRIRAAWAAQRCPKALLYHSGVLPFRSTLQMWVSLDLPEPQGSSK